MMLGGNSEMTPCVEGSDEHLMFCQVMEELESLCQQQFSCFMVIGYTEQVVAGMMYQVKIKVAESGDTPIVHAKIMKHLPNTGRIGPDPELVMFKANQAEDAPFNFTDMDVVMRALGMGMVEQPEANANEEMKDESQPTTTEDAAAQEEQP